MKPMPMDEYLGHIKESFEDRYFEGDDNFLFSKSALVDGLSHIEHDSMWLEHSLEPGKEILRRDLVYMARKMQAVANILRTSLDGIRLQTH